jgi:predicted acyltransferase (DUF342 family)
VLLDPLVLLVLLLLASLGFIVILLVPSLLEVKKPKDRGPRKIVKATLNKLAGADVRVLNGDVIKISDDVCFPSGFEVEENVVVNGSLTVGDRCYFHKSLKAEGNVKIGCDVVFGGNLVADGSVDIGDGTVIGGSIDATGDVKLGEKVFVRLSVVSGGNVELYENSEVKKIIVTHGMIRVLEQPRLECLSALEDVG